MGLKENDKIFISRKKKLLEENNGAGNDDLQNFGSLDLVWAKCTGYPWYPALIINPELATQEPLLHGDEELPQPGPDIIEMGKKINDDGEIHHLVLFFDQRRTWQWLPNTKIALLGKDKKFDNSKLKEGKTPAQRS